MPFTDEEKEHLIDALLTLTNDQIKLLLRNAGLRPAGETKAKFDAALRAALAAGTLTFEQIIGWLDERDPWRRQHVYLYEGRAAGVGPWANPTFVAQQLNGHAHAACLNTSVPVALPTDMTFSSIRHSDFGLRITAYVRRDHRSRVQEMDRTETMPDGRRILWQAWHEYTVRTAVAFEWDFPTNKAQLQITELPSRESYDDLRDAFAQAVRPWFPAIDEFPPLDLRRAIGALHRHEAAGGSEVQAYLMAYTTTGGRHVEGRGGSGQQPFLGETASDDALKLVRDSGVGRNGNFHWLPNGGALASRVHTYVNAYAGRVRFYVDQEEAVVRHVLGRIRHYCI